MENSIRQASPTPIGARKKLLSGTKANLSPFKFDCAQHHMPMNSIMKR